MIPNSAIYNIDESLVAEDCAPPSRRKPIYLAWLISLLTPMQWAHDLIFNDYANGSNAPVWATGTSYAYLDRVAYTDGAVYELVNTSGLTSTTPPNSDTTNWIKVLDNFIGLRQRLRFTGQKLSLEIALNTWFRVGSVATPFTGASHTTQIWIENQTLAPLNYMTNSSTLAVPEYLANTSAYARAYMGDGTTTTYASFIIHVPTATYAAIGLNQPTGVTADDAIRAFADQYVQAGKLYKIQTY